MTAVAGSRMAVWMNLVWTSDDVGFPCPIVCKQSNTEPKNSMQILGCMFDCLQTIGQGKPTSPDVHVIKFLEFPKFGISRPPFIAIVLGF